MDKSAEPEKRAVEEDMWDKNLTLFMGIASILLALIVLFHPGSYLSPVFFVGVIALVPITFLMVVLPPRNHVPRFAIYLLVVLSFTGIIMVELRPLPNVPPIFSPKISSGDL